MAFTFTQTQLDILRREDPSNPGTFIGLIPDAESSHNWTPVYNYIFEQITDNYGTANELPKTGVDKSVWLWVQGATQVNADDGSYFSDFIRDYTTTQYELRYGTTTGLDIDAASDQIARAFALDIADPQSQNFGFLPNINRVGAIDAGEIAAGIFGDNYSPWAGTILFPFLGEGDFTRQWLLTTETSEFKKLAGTYDLISVASASWEIANLWDAYWNSGLNQIIAQNSIGENATLQLLADLRNEANTFFQSVYALDNIEQFQIGGDLPLYGANILSAPEYTARPNYIVGTLNDDVGIQNIVTFDSDSIFGGGDDIVHAGLGNDEIKGSSGDDLIDGGEGIDTLDYLPVSEGLTVTFEAITTLNDYFDHRILIQEDTFFLGFTDYAYDIEKLKLTTANDIIRFNPTVEHTFHIDGAGNGKDQDVVDYSLYTTAVDVDLINGLDSLGNILIDIEGVILSDAGGNAFADLRNNLIQGGSGNDIIIGGGGNDTLLGGAGDDYGSFRANSAQNYSFFDGGEDFDFFELNGGGDFLLFEDYITTQSGIAQGVEGVNIANVYGGSSINVYTGSFITVAELGWAFELEDKRDVAWIDYSRSQSGLSIDLGSGNWLVTDGSTNDLFFNSASSRAKFVGSNHGDEVLMGGGVNQTVWLGTGNDTVSFAPDSAAGTKQITYSGGTDVVHDARTADVIMLDPFIRDADDVIIFLPANDNRRVFGKLREPLTLLSIAS